MTALYPSTRVHTDAGVLMMMCDACGGLRPRRAMDAGLVDCQRRDGSADTRIVYRCIAPGPCLDRARANRWGIFAP